MALVGIFLILILGGVVVVGVRTRDVSFVSLLQNIKSIVLRFPFASACAIGAAVVSILLATNELSEENSLILFTLIIGISHFIGCVLAGESLGIGGIAAQAIGVVVLFFMDMSYRNSSTAVTFTRFAQYLLATHLFVSFAPFLKPGKLVAFWQYNGILLFSITISFFYSHLIFALYAALLGSMQGLFNLRIDGDVYLSGYFISVFVISTAIFLSHIPHNFKDSSDEEIFPGGLRALTHFILIPFVLLYLAVLYIYLGKILITRELPKGLISWLVCAFGLFGLITWLLVYPLRNKASGAVNFFIRYFFSLMLPLLGLLFYAIYLRVSDYGITEHRYFLIVLSLWITVISIYILSSRTKNIKTIPLSLALLAVLTAFGPWGAYSVSWRSQAARLKEAFQDAKLNLEVPSSAVGIADSKEREISSILKYIIEVHGTDRLRDLFEGNKEVNVLLDDGKYSHSHKNSPFKRSADHQLKVDILKLWGIEGLDYDYSINFGLTADRQDMLEISGFDYFFPVQYLYGNNHIKLTGVTENFDIFLEKNEISIRIHENKVIKFPLEELFTRLSKTYRNGSSFQSATIPSKDMFLESELDGRRYRLALIYLGGKMAGDMPEIANVQFVLMITK